MSSTRNYGTLLPFKEENSLPPLSPSHFQVQKQFRDICICQRDALQEKKKWNKTKTKQVEKY